MIKARCIAKDRNKNNVIVGYNLIDENNQVRYFKSEDLKRKIMNGVIDTVNLKLTTDGKLIDKPENNFSDLIEKVKNSNERTQYILYNRYHKVMEDIGVDIVGAFYTIYNTQMIDRSGINSSGIQGKLSNEQIKLMIEHPEKFVGKFSDMEYGGNMVTRGYNGDFYVSLPVLILHKNNELRAVMFYEVNYLNELEMFGKDFESTPEVYMSERKLKKNPNLRYPQPLNNVDYTYKNRRGYKVMTINSNGKLGLIDLESYISEQESKKLGKMIVNSNIAYWISSYTYENITKVVYEKARKYSEYKDIADKSMAVAEGVGGAAGVLGIISLFAPALAISLTLCTGAVVAVSPVVLGVDYLVEKVKEKNK